MELNQLMPVYQQDGVSCYKVEGYQCLNDYYIVSEEKSRYLMNHPEVVGYEVYQSLVPAT